MHVAIAKSLLTWPNLVWSEVAIVDVMITLSFTRGKVDRRTVLCSQLYQSISLHQVPPRHANIWSNKKMRNGWMEK